MATPTKREPKKPAGGLRHRGANSPQRQPLIFVPANEDHEQMPPTFQSVALVEIENEPRVRDIDLAERLGFDRPRDIRKLIERNLSEIERFGVCPAVGRTSGPKGGRPTSEFYLNEEQALLVSVLSNAPNAPAVRAMLINTFVAYRRGQLTDFSPGITDAEARKVIGGIVKAVITKQIETIIPQLVQAEIVSHQYVGVRGLTAGEVLDIAGFTNRKGLRGLSGFVSGRLRRFHALKGHASPIATLGRSSAYVFDRALSREWLDTGGRQSVEMKIAEKRGQTVLKLAPRTTVSDVEA